MTENERKGLEALFGNAVKSHYFILEHDDDGIMLASPYDDHVLLYTENESKAKQWLWKYYYLFAGYPSITLAGTLSASVFHAQFKEYEMKGQNFWLWPADRVPVLQSAKELQYRKAIPEDREWLIDQLKNSPAVLSDQELKNCILDGRILIAFAEEEPACLGILRQDGSIGPVFGLAPYTNAGYEKDVEARLIEMALQKGYVPCALVSEDDQAASELQRQSGMICCPLPVSQSVLNLSPEQMMAALFAGNPRGFF